MTEESRPSVPPESLRNAIHSQHPGIAGEIEGAINTLQKLKQLAGSHAPVNSAGAGGSDLSALMATEAIDARPPGAPATDTKTIDATENEPGTRREIPILSASTSFGRYQIVRLLGRGAMGAVYLAYDTQLHRHVALKTPFIGDSPKIIERFYREARSAAQLRSPYICPLYDVGQIGGVSYLSMAFIEGQSLTRVITDGRLKDVGAIAAITQKIARGLQKAHELGIIHRDLKPDNIMIDRDGEPIVMDFGLARRLNEEVHITMPGSILGTPAYMSPEQVDGDASKVGPPTDIYSLGVVLFQMLTHRLPFQGSLTSVLRQIGSGEIPRPSAINPEVGEDSPIEQICRKMMAKSIADRYPSMADVAEAIEQLSPRVDMPVARASVLNTIKSWSKRIFAFLTVRAKSASSSAGRSPGTCTANTELMTNTQVPRSG